MDITPQLEIDYRTEPLEQGDVFVLATDGVYESVDSAYIAGLLNALESDFGDLDGVATAMNEELIWCESTDNLTVQIVRIERLPQSGPEELHTRLNEFPCTPILDAHAEFDGNTIVRKLNGSSRSHLYLTVDNPTSTLVVIKAP